jgi:hypothetical protein
MTVYKGVLHEISEGEKISSEGTGGYYTHRMGITRWHKTGVDQQAGFIRREILAIGDTRIRNVMLMPYFDTLLREAIGKEVALSVDGGPPEEFSRHTVLAIRTPDAGVVRPSMGKMIFASIVVWFRFWLTAVVGGFLVAVVAGFAGSLVSKLLGDDNGYGAYVGLALGGLFFLYFLLKPFQIIYKTFRLRSARLTLDGELVEGYSAADSAY